MHPNTNPPTLRKGWERVGQNVRFLILMMIIPEIVVGWAWIERKSAEKIKHDFEEKGWYSKSPLEIVADKI